MFDYIIDAPLPAALPHVWSQLTLQPLAGAVLTPFSLSVIEEVAGRAWYAYYDRLGFNPPPRPRVTRRHRGRLYMDDSYSAQLDAEHAGLSAPKLRLNGQIVPLFQTEKPGFWASLKQARAQRRIDALWAALDAELDAITRNAEAWYRKTHELRWTQAEVLQVMEEIERIATPGMTAFFAARHGLLLAYNYLILATLDRGSYPTNLALINDAVGDLDGLAELEIAHAVADLAKRMDIATLDWVRRSDLHTWRESIPSPELAEGVTDFLARYGHRASGEAEMRNPRWAQDPGPLFRSLAACHARATAEPARMPGHSRQRALLESVDPKRHKDVMYTLDQVRRLLLLQSRSLDALAYVLAGTRLWALAAAKEAMADGRLRNADEVFFFEVEEMKQMMTGEWNVSDVAGIHATVARRTAEYEGWRGEQPGDLLLGDQEATAAQPGLPAVGGRAVGPLRSRQDGQANGSTAAIIGTELMDAGVALTLPMAAGFVAGGGTPVDASAAAARFWQKPAVVGLGAPYRRLREGAQTTVDGDAVTVAQ